MSEMLKTNDEAGERDSAEPLFPEDPNQYSEEELMADPAKRFHVNPKDFPIFSKQSEKSEKWNEDKRLPIDETLGRYVKATADCIAVLTGEDEGDDTSSEKLPAADHIIYLDKSARPVSWLNNVFWDSFTDKPRPKHSYLAIDRIEWFRRTDTPVDAYGYVKDANGETSHLASFEEDFIKENVTDEDIARIRALYIPGGIGEDIDDNNIDVEKIMNTPTNLKGKNITIIDEVAHSGSTLKIAAYLVSRAIPEAASVNGYTFWNAGTQVSADGEQHQMRSAPVWYDKNSRLGRGIGDVNEDFFAKRYEQYPTRKTRAQKIGSFVLGEFVDLSREPGGKSRELAKEIKLMRKEWDKGHIMMSKPEHYSTEKWMERLESQGVEFVPQQPRMPKNSYNTIREDISNRAPALW